MYSGPAERRGTLTYYFEGGLARKSALFFFLSLGKGQVYSPMFALLCFGLDCAGWGGGREQGGTEAKRRETRTERKVIFFASSLNARFNTSKLYGTSNPRFEHCLTHMLKRNPKFTI